MNILVCNDDGINALGLKQLVLTMSEVADVYVLAPDGERSGNSHHISINKKMHFEKKDIPGAKEAYSLAGTPVDCVHLAMNYFFKDRIDLVISGINQGKNASTDIIYSGTIAAAREAFIRGFPAVASSLGSYTGQDYLVASEFTRDIVLQYYLSKNNTDYFININVPAIPKEEIKGIKVCHKSTFVSYEDKYEISEDNDGTYIRMVPAADHIFENNKDLDVDIVAMSEGYVSVTPLYNQHINKDKLKEVEEFLTLLPII